MISTAGTKSSLMLDHPRIAYSTINKASEKLFLIGWIHMRLLFYQFNLTKKLFYPWNESINSQTAYGRGSCLVNTLPILFRNVRSSMLGLLVSVGKYYRFSWSHFSIIFFPHIYQIATVIFLWKMTENAIQTQPKSASLKGRRICWIVWYFEFRLNFQNVSESET